MSSFSTSPLSMPVRIALPQSIVNNLSYTLLYAGNAKAISDFAIHKKPLALEDVEANPRYVQFVLKKERGPTVDYSNISANLSVMRKTMARSPTGSVTLQFFTNLMALRYKWKKAALKFHSYDIFTKMIRAFFVDRTDAQFLRILDCMSPAAVEDWKTACIHFSSPAQRMHFQNEWQKIYAEYDAVSRQLFAFKVSDEMWMRMGQLREAIETHAQLVTNLQVNAERKRKIRQLRRQDQKNRNASMLMAQMGQTGVQTLDPGAITAVEEMFDQQYKSHFQFTEKQDAGLHCVNREEDLQAV